MTVDRDGQHPPAETADFLAAYEPLRGAIIKKSSKEPDQHTFLKLAIFGDMK